MHVPGLRLRRPAPDKTGTLARQGLYRRFTPAVLIGPVDEDRITRLAASSTAKTVARPPHVGPDTPDSLARAMGAGRLAPRALLGVQPREDHLVAKLRPRPRPRLWAFPRLRSKLG